MRRSPALAKLTLPRLHTLIRRERLFTVINERCRHHPLVWVAGPPGAGKTALIASYLTEQKQRTLWYHIDPGDADLATFFHYLAQAAQAAAGRKHLCLPALTPEYMADVPGFTRRFMRELWSKVALPARVVLDNYQELPIEAPLHKVLPIALAEFPAGASLIVISREEAPELFARELVHNSVGHIRWDDLRFTVDETASLARSVAGLNEDTIRLLHAKANGWVAGTVLLLERMKANETWNIPALSDTITEVFSYFAEAVFLRLEPRIQDVLMRTALLPWMTGAMAEEVSAHPEAAQIVFNLYRRGLFVDRRTDAQIRYQYHDLFREFLRNRCQRQYSEQHRQSMKSTAARVAERAGQQDTAVELYAETNAWDDLSRVICESAEQLLIQGRNHTLQRYIGLFPETERDKRPWLLYWSGISRLVFDPVTGRKDLEQAYQLFESSQTDLSGLLLSCSGIIDAYYCCRDDMAPTIAWGDRLHHILQRQNGFPSPAIEIRVRTSLQGLFLSCPHHPLVLKLDQSFEPLLRSLGNSTARVSMGLSFMNLLVWRGDFIRLRQMLEELATCRNAILSPLHQFTWTLMEGLCAWGTGKPAHAQVKFGEALGLAEQHGIEVFKTRVRDCEAYNALSIGDDKDVERLAGLLQDEPLSHRRFALGLYYFFRAGIAFLRGDYPSALQFASSAVHTTERLSVALFSINFREGLAKVFIELGEMEKARDLLQKAIDDARVMRSGWGETRCLLALAYSYLRDGRSDLAHDYLREGLEVAHRHQHVLLDIWWRPKVMADILAHALKADIEVEYVRSLIRRRGLRAPSASLKHWPYPVNISTLGLFEIAIHDVPLTYHGKAQRKPLELLQYLCAASAQRAPQDLIEEALWPDTDGDAADQAFRVALHRLRKLLRHEEAVRLVNRQVSLDLSLVSVDRMSFERLAQDCDRTSVAAIECTLALYRGHFLPGQTASWALPVRERLRAQFLELTECLGDCLEAQGKTNVAVQQYLRALEVEPVAEVMCRRVMMTFLQLGRRTEAIGVYQRFSHALQKKLGVLPTPETLALYHRITTT